ncbi:hypothetical protein WA1_24410 [Scytonema hofmannii PCC 7110]|uniref:DUF3598 domain-containing protein n=1 Tax=Scytonema hofmannii PCC 7110 TaxID=128403 RepID=A0A139X7X3_9CYAN|nr:DUF3598 family protein [Scytonema hofmannii]KYC40776.1 hypothetical protein WA1_24410 [Scytonema hofmannii PCC 7110]
MAPHSIDNVAERENQLQNWDRFCQYHLGDWHGIWTKYSPEGHSINSFKCVRSFYLSEDGSQIVQQNRSTSPDGKTDLHTFAYVKPSTELSFMGHHFAVLFLDNSFSWGSIKFTDADAQFFFETGFTHENRRTSLTAVYKQSGELQHMTAISEQLDSFSEALPAPSVIQPDDVWQGTVKKITPDLVTSASEEIGWQLLESLGGNHQIFHLPGGSISCPFKIESYRVMNLIVDWQAAPNKLFRGIRRFDNSEFSHFLLQVYES